MMAGLSIVLAILTTLQVASSFTLEHNNRTITLVPTSNGITVSVKLGDRETLTGTLASGRNFIKDGNVLPTVSIVGAGFKIFWETKNLEEKFLDCFDLKPDTHWYGGPQKREQFWPIEQIKIDGAEAYVSRKDDNFAVCERYWLNSHGTYIYVKDYVPLFVDQNVKNNNTLCFSAKAVAPYIGRNRNVLEYDIIVRQNPTAAHLDAVKNYLGKPTGHPERRMFEQPIWTTWAKYKKDIDDNIVQSFAKGVRDHGFENGQVEIDDNWERCYGAQEFSDETFSGIGDTVKKLQSMDFKVTLWVHPFVNDDCQNNTKEGLEKGYFVRNTQNDTIATWWDGDNAHQIDFTKPDAAEWFSARLRNIQSNYGIDAFKFDAGETNYAPQPSVYENVDPETVPNVLTSNYIRTCAKFGKLIEVRSAFMTQDLPIFVRMLDKDSNWGFSNGLKTLVTTLLQLNINGYTMVLPDMIGGNGYDGELPDTELLIRWTQANTFMPAMQFSYLPWDFQPANTTTIIKKFVDLHKNHANDIEAAMNESIHNGIPVNAPIWWVAPDDEVALKCNDEYLLGTNILVAPVLDKGKTSRDVYLPKGQWIDGNNGSKYQGPVTLKGFPAPIYVLPWFIKQD